MISKCSLPFLSNWNSSFINNSVSIKPLNFQNENNFIQTMIAANNQKFKRFFTKKPILEDNPPEKMIYFDEKTSKEYESKCEQGDVEAIHIYGDSLLGGTNGAKIDKEKAVRYFKIGADRNDTECMFQYAFCLFRGEGIQPDIEKAVTILKETAKRGHLPSMYYLYQCYLNGAKIDKIEALHYLKVSADKNYIYSIISYGFQLPNNDPQRIEYFKKAADQDNPIGEFLYGNELLKCNKKDVKKGLFYIKKSADKGNYLAQFEYGKLLYEGQVTAKDLKSSSHYFDLSLKSGNPEVYYDYANFLLKQEKKTETDLNKIKEYMKKSADMGYVNSMVSYAMMIANGIVKTEKGPIESIPYLQKAIDKKSTAAMIFYAKMAEKGIGFSQKEPQIAEKYFLMAAETDKTAESYRHLIEFYSNQKEYQKMTKYMKIAADTNDEKALFDYGSFLLFNGELEKAKEYLRKSSEKGYADGMNLYSTTIIKENPNEAFKLLKSAINQGCGPAMFNFANFVSDGEFSSLKIDKKEAFKYMKMAAEKGVDGAVLKLADWLFMGINCEKNVTEAMKYFKLSADKTNNPYSLFIYGYTKLRGFQKVRVDTKVGFKYIKMAADQNFSPAINQLGNIYDEGIGVKKDEKMAAKYYKLAADMDDVQAIENYVKYLMNGKAVEKNEKEAARYLMKGAELGDAYCNYNLGLLYMKGIGVDLNYDEGMKYLKIAKEKGIEHALEIGEHYYKKNAKK